MSLRDYHFKDVKLLFSTSLARWKLAGWWISGWRVYGQGTKVSKSPMSLVQSYNDTSGNKFIVRLVCYHPVLPVQFELIKFQKFLWLMMPQNYATIWTIHRVFCPFLDIYHANCRIWSSCQIGLGQRKQVHYFSLKGVLSISKFSFHGAKTEQINYFSWL